MYTPPFKMAQCGARHFPNRGSVCLFALPCPDQQKAAGFQSIGRVDEGQFESFAGKFSALGETSEEASDKFVELRDAALDGIRLLRRRK